MTRAVRDFMTTPVVTVRQDTPFKVILTRMLAARAGAVPVIDDSGLVMFTPPGSGYPSLG